MNRHVSHFFLGGEILIAPCLWRRVGFFLSVIFSFLIIEGVSDHNDPTLFLSCFLLGSIILETLFLYVWKLNPTALWTKDTLQRNKITRKEFADYMKVTLKNRMKCLAMTFVVVGFIFLRNPEYMINGFIIYAILRMTSFNLLHKKPKTKVPLTLVVMANTPKIFNTSSPNFTRIWDTGGYSTGTPVFSADGTQIGCF